MKFKKGVSLFLCLIMIFSTALIPSHAAIAINKAHTPALINATEKIAGVFANSFAKLINKIKDTDETDIVQHRSNKLPEERASRMVQKRNHARRRYGFTK